MTTSVKVTAHCSSDKQVLFLKSNTKNYGGQAVVLQDGESHEMVVYDNWQITVREEVTADMKVAEELVRFTAYAKKQRMDWG